MTAKVAILDIKMEQLAILYLHVALLPSAKFRLNLTYSWEADCN